MVRNTKEGGKTCTPVPAPIAVFSKDFHSKYMNIAWSIDTLYEVPDSSYTLYREPR